MYILYENTRFEYLIRKFRFFYSKWIDNSQNEYYISIIASSQNANGGEVSEKLYS